MPRLRKADGEYQISEDAIPASTSWSCSNGMRDTNRLACLGESSNRPEFEKGNINNKFWRQIEQKNNNK